VVADGSRAAARGARRLAVRDRSGAGRSRTHERSLQPGATGAPRLRGLGEAAREHATALRALHQAGVAPKGIKATDDWQPPVELHAENALRPGAIESWQALDRSFQGLLAALDDPDASFAHHAAAYETVATATDTITEALANVTGTDLATGCSFCGKPRPQLRKLIAGPGVYICDECVALCVEILEEVIGENWREEAEQRLGGENQDDE
jgi:hypothetical protein